MNTIILETFKERLLGLCDEMDIDAAFFVFAAGNGEMYGGTVDNGKTPKTFAMQLVEGLAAANSGALSSMEGML